MDNRKTLNFYQILNILGLILVLVMNYLAVALPLAGKSTGELSDLYPNLFTPAGFTFSIWGILYLSLIVFVVFQSRGLFSSKEIPYYVGQIGPWFFINTLANASWLLAWHYQYLGLSFLIMLMILASLLVITDRLEIGEAKPSKAITYGVFMPFQLYLGWISVATIANATAVLVAYDWSGWGIQPQVWTVLMLLVVMALGLLLLRKRNDYFYVLVLIWASMGIIAKRIATEPEVFSVILTATLLITILTIASLYTLFRRS